MTPAERARHVPVYPTELVPSAGVSNLPSVAGKYEVDGDTLCFVPTYPFISGTSYTVLVHHSLVEAAATSELDDFDPFTITRPSDDVMEPAAFVVEVHPNAEEVPRNLLRFYSSLLGPDERRLRRRPRARRRRGNPRTAARSAPPDGPRALGPRPDTRATVLFDPARIKRGLAPHREAGYPLREGATIEVVVDAGFADAHGRPLADEFVRRYRVVGDVRRRVEPAEWEIEAPGSGTRDPLVVRFDRPLDHALLQRCLAVVDAEAAHLPGRVAVPDGERSWEFTPAAEWPDARCALVVDTTLEDLAGNSVARVFDRELADPDHDPIAAKTVTLEFRPHAP